MRILRLIFLALLFVPLVSCRQKAEGAIEIDVDEATLNGYKDWIESVKIIPLATSEQCLIGGVNKILFYDNDYYLLDRKSLAVYRFSNNGDFICSSKSVSREIGPKGYYSLLDFDIDRSNGKIYLLDPVKRQIIETNKEFSSMKSLKIENADLLSISQFAHIGNEKFILVSDNKLKIFDTYNQTLLDEVEIKPFDDNLHIRLFSPNGKDQILFSHLSNNLVLFSDEQIKETYQFDFGRQTLSPEFAAAQIKEHGEGALQEECKNKYVMTSEYFTNEDYIFVLYFYKEQFYTTLYSKRSKKTQTSYSLFGTSEQFKISHLKEGNTFLCTLFPNEYELLSFREFLSTEQPKVEYDANPVIIEYTLKSDL